MAFRLFGYTFGPKASEVEDPQKLAEIKPDPQKTFSPPQNPDGSITVDLSAGAAFLSTYLPLEIEFKTDTELINRYREMSMHPEVDEAINDIINEAIVQDDDGEEIVSLDLDGVPYTEELKDAIQSEFQTILQLLNFKKLAYDLFRQWYVDGRLYVHTVIDEEKPEEGIKELRLVDPRAIRKVREILRRKDPISAADLIHEVKEYFIYNEMGFLPSQTSPHSAAQAQGVRISPEAVVYAISGLFDITHNQVLGYLHKAIKALNQLRMIEDAIVIYRLSRAPERRIFYIDVGSLPTNRADAYVRDIMTKYRNRLVYDQNTGEVKDDRRHMNMLEDFWLPRREGGRGTEITTLQGGQNLGELEDVEYFKKKLYKALGVPVTRLEPTSGNVLGRAAEITRDEVQFGRFVARLRQQFSTLLLIPLKRQLVLKGLINEDDWVDLSAGLKLVFARDNHFTELKELEIINARVDAATKLTEFTGEGKYFSHAYIQKNIFKLTDQQIDDMEREKDEQAGTYEDPEDETPFGGGFGMGGNGFGGPPNNFGGENDLGQETATDDNATEESTEESSSGGDIESFSSFSKTADKSK